MNKIYFILLNIYSKKTFNNDLATTTLEKYV